MLATRDIVRGVVICISRVIVLVIDCALDIARAVGIIAIDDVCVVAVVAARGVASAGVIV